MVAEWKRWSGSNFSGGAAVVAVSEVAKYFSFCHVVMRGRQRGKPHPADSDGVSSICGSILVGKKAHHPSLGAFLQATVGVNAASLTLPIVAVAALSPILQRCGHQHSKSNPEDESLGWG